jgi:LPXTG-motif cell wall-anchored protein
MVQKVNKEKIKMNSQTRWTQGLLVLAVGAVCFALTVSASAQVQTETSTTSHAPTVNTHVERGTVVYVSGNDFVIKMDDGSLRHFNNVPESTTVTVDGKEIGIHDVKVGMQVQKTVTTTTTPKTVTTVQSVTGKVWNVSPPNSVILTLDDGTNQQFKIPKGQKFSVNGQMLDAFGLKKGMQISATKIVESPEMVVDKQTKLSGTMPPPPPAPPADQPILVAVMVPVPVAAPAAPAPEALPKTGSQLPLIGLLGFLALAASLGLKAVRRAS